MADENSLSAKFGRAKFFSEEFFPYALYYLGLLTFEDQMTLNIPNLAIRNMFVDYYDELSEFTNVSEARRGFGLAAKALALGDGTWKALFDAYWQHYVKARIPAQAFDKMNELAACSQYARENPERLSGNQVFGSIRERIHAGRRLHG